MFSLYTALSIIGTGAFFLWLIVAGRTIVRDGRILGLDIEAAHREMRDQFRTGITDRAGFRAALPPLENASAQHYASRIGCC